MEFIKKAKLIASVLDESLSNLVVSFLESYVKSHTEELKAIGRLQAKARRGRLITFSQMNGVKTINKRRIEYLNGFAKKVC